MVVADTELRIVVGKEGAEYLYEIPVNLFYGDPINLQFATFNNGGAKGICVLPGRSRVNVTVNTCCQAIESSCIEPVSEFDFQGGS